jgi:transposase
MGHRDGIFRPVDQKDVFAVALGLAGTPWKVVDVSFDRELKRLNIELDFPPGSRFPHPATGEPCAVYDTEHRSWRHLNFFQFECYVNAHVPRVDGGPDAGVKRVAVPWARPQSGFTLLMESMMLVLAQSGMTVAEAARVVGEYPQRVWSVLLRHVALAHGRMDLESVRVVSIDEVCRARGHNYLTIVSEPKRDGRPTRVLLAVEGRDSGALRKFADHLRRRGLAPEQIETICSDMSPAYIKGISEEFAGALLVFDYFHVVQLVSQALDQVRRRERREFPEQLKGVRWAMLKGEDKLTEDERATRRRVCAGKLQTGKAFNHLDALRSIMREPDAARAERDLLWWCGWVGRSKIPEMKKAARTIRAHWDGVVAYLKTRVTNGAAEALNGIIQTVKRKARGFRTVEYFSAMIYLVASGLKFDLPDPLPTTHTTSH